MNPDECEDMRIRAYAMNADADEYEKKARLLRHNAAAILQYLGSNTMIIPAQDNYGY